MDSDQGSHIQKVTGLDGLESYHHEPDIKVASTLPSDWYTREEFFHLEVNSVFNKSWNLLGSTAALKKRGDYFTAQAGLENIITVKTGTDIGDLKGLVNVCRHRAGPVALGCGTVQAFQCRYHGWVYDLHGKLIGTPEFQGVENFSKEDCPLPTVSLAQRGPLVFASLKPAVGFAEFFENIGDEKDGGFLNGSLIPFLEKDYPVRCNWKVYVDNYLEGYHLPLVHHGLSAELDYAQYRTVTSRWYSEQFAPAKASAAHYRSERGALAKYFWLFPNTMLNVYQGVVQTNVVLPISKDETVVKFVWYSTPENVERAGAALEELVKLSDVIQEEDRQICEHVQRNLKSSTYATGRYSVKRENGVHHFHQLLYKSFDKNERRPLS